jgi:hypothetical protein
MTAISDAEWAESTPVMVSIMKLWHGMWWRTLLLLKVHRHGTYVSADFCKHRTFHYLLSMLPSTGSIMNAHRLRMYKEHQWGNLLESSNLQHQERDGSSGHGLGCDTV